MTQKRISYLGWTVALLAAFFSGALLISRPARAVPQPISVQIQNTIPTTVTELDSEVSVGATVTTVAAISAGRQAIYLQNLSTVTVCCSKVNTVTCGATPANAGTVLKASTAGADGSGGTWSLSQYSGPVYCTATTGPAIITVSSFQR